MGFNKRLISTTAAASGLDDFKFQAVAYPSVAGTSQSLTSVGFQPDLVWIKARTYGYSWQVYDSVRGVGNDKALFLSENYVEGSTAAEGNAQQYGYLSAFGSSGFTINEGTTNGVYVGTGATGHNMGSWHWKASNSSAANTQGGKASVVSAANGFSVVTYTGSAGGTQTVGHGLETAPKLIIQKQRTGTLDWYTYVAPGVIDATTQMYYLVLNNDDAKATTGSGPLVTDTTINAASTSGDFVAYCFHDVAGKLKIGTYEAQQSAGSPTITTGFQPDFVMIKNLDRAQEWVLLDSARGLDKYLLPNANSNESTGNDISVNSTSFTIEASGSGVNYASGDKMLYMAIKNC